MTSTTKPALPLGIRRIDPDRIACKNCGTLCAPDTPREMFTVSGRSDPHGVVMDVHAEAWFGTCPACADHAAHAARVLDAHPRIQRAIGSPSIGRYRIASAFAALAVLGVSPADSYDADALMSLLDLLSVPGASTSWHRRFSPVWLDDAARDTAATEPWAHVGVELRAEIRRQYLDYLADRMPPRRVSCPTGGCAWCGMGDVLARRTARPWAAHSMAPAALGGNGPRALSVHLCPTCEAARSAGGSMRSAVLDAVDPDRALRRRRPYEPDPHGVIGWALVGGTPNRAPWSHLDLDGLRELLASADY